MKFALRVIQEFEADDENAAQQFVMEQIKTGMRENCMIELARIPEEAQEVSEGEVSEEISFHDLLNNLNSGDMTKN